MGVAQILNEIRRMLRKGEKDSYAYGVKNFLENWNILKVRDGYVQRAWFKKLILNMLLLVCGPHTIEGKG